LTNQIAPFGGGGRENGRFARNIIYFYISEMLAKKNYANE
jgi:hypothetical protein